MVHIGEQALLTAFIHAVCFYCSADEKGCRGERLRIPLNEVNGI